MAKVQVTKITKTYVSVVITTKTGKELKQTIRNTTGFNDAIGFLNDNKDIKILLEACKDFLPASDYAGLKKLYFPTAKQTKVARESAKARQNWLTKNEKMLDAEIEKMARHPGFLGTGVTRKEINSTVCKEVQALYAI